MLMKIFFKTLSKRGTTLFAFLKRMETIYMSINRRLAKKKLK